MNNVTSPVFLEVSAFSYASRYIKWKSEEGIQIEEGAEQYWCRSTGCERKGHGVCGWVGRGESQLISPFFRKGMWCSYPYRSLQSSAQSSHVILTAER